jgi:hypothetical protein
LSIGLEISGKASGASGATGSQPIINTEPRNLDLIRGDPTRVAGRGSNTECGITEFNNRTLAGLLSGWLSASAGHGTNYRIRNYGITIELLYSIEYQYASMSTGNGNAVPGTGCLANLRRYVRVYNLNLEPEPSMSHRPAPYPVMYNNNYTSTVVLSLLYCRGSKPAPAGLSVE